MSSNVHAPKQLYLSGFVDLGKKEFGGSLLKGNPRESRPISIKRPLHLVMRSSLARNELTFLAPKRAKRIENAIRRQATLQGVKIFRYANSGNHLHLIILPRSRIAFRAFIRGITGVIARITLRVERGNAVRKKFWDARPFTRLIEWGREFKTVSNYVVQNTLEAIGFMPYQPRQHKARLLSAVG